MNLKLAKIAQRANFVQVHLKPLLAIVFNYCTRSIAKWHYFTRISARPQILIVSRLDSKTVHDYCRNGALKVLLFKGFKTVMIQLYTNRCRTRSTPSPNCGQKLGFVKLREEQKTIDP
jgi:hypothetical protein